MTDYTELKRLAEAAPTGPWIAENDSLYFKDDGYTRHLLDADAGHDVEDEAYYAALKFIAATNPAAVLALIAENELLKAEVAGLKTGYQAYERVNAELKAEAEKLRKSKSEPCDGCFMAEAEALRKDKDRLDALEGNFWDVRFDSSPNGDSGDSSVSIEIVGHWMDKPNERVIGENYNENLRAAIDQAMKAPAYPPARPEYPEFDDIPDFTPGNGNSARRRAESLGIDYDTAMGKGGKS